MYKQKLATRATRNWEKYLISLNKEIHWFTPSIYYPAWGLFEIKGDTYSDMN